MKCKFQENIMLGKRKINYKNALFKSASRLYLTHGAKLQNTHKTSKVKYGSHLILLKYTLSSFIIKFPLLHFVSTHFISTCNSFFTSSQRWHGHLSVLSLRPLNFHILSESCYPTPFMHVTCSFPTLFLYPNMQLKTNFPSLSPCSLVFACKWHLLVVTWHVALTFCSCLVKFIPVQFSVQFIPFCCPTSHFKYPIWSYISLRIS